MEKYLTSCLGRYTLAVKMKENPKKLFRLALENKQGERNIPQNPLWEASLRFEKTHEKELIETEQYLLNSAPIATVIDILDEAATSIEKQEGFSATNKDTYKRGGEYKLQKTIFFEVDALGRHGDGFYPSWESEGKYTETVESGKVPRELVKSVLLSYNYSTIRIAVEIVGLNDPEKSDTTVMNWHIGSSTGKLIAINSDFSQLVDLLTNKIVSHEYNDYRTTEGQSYETGWS